MVSTISISAVSSGEHVFLRPLAFRIQNYKSIADSGVCTLSGDNITVLAGQNEAGKTSVLTALKDFNSEIDEPATTKDFVPDHAPDVEPEVAVLMRVDVEDLLSTASTSKQYVLPDNLIARLRESPQIWVYRFPLNGGMNFEDEIEALWPASEESGQENGEETSETDSDEAASSGGGPTRRCTYQEFQQLCWQNWPVFIYFDSFDDILPREVGIDLLVSSGSTPSASQKVKNPPLPQSVQDFLKLSGINLEKVRKLDKAHEEKQLKNYLNSRSAEITGDFLGYWKREVVVSRL